MINWYKFPHFLASLSVYLCLYKDITFVAIQIEDSDIQNGNFVYLILGEQIWRKVFYTTLALDIPLERSELQADVLLLSESY